MTEEIHTSGGASVGGNAETGGGDFAGRDKNTNEVTINIPMPTWANLPAKPPRKKRAPIRGELMADAAQELWKTIGEMKETMGGFRQAVDMNSQATKEQALSIKELTKVVEQSNQRYDAANLRMSEQIMALRQVAKAISGMGIQIPDNGNTELAIIVPPPPWWKEYLMPAIITIGFAIIIFYLATGGHIP